MPTDPSWGLFPALPQPAALPCHGPFPEASAGTSQVLHSDLCALFGFPIVPGSELHISPHTTVRSLEHVAVTSFSLLPEPHSSLF